MNSPHELFPGKEYPLSIASPEKDEADKVRHALNRQMREILVRLRISPDSTLLKRLNFLTAVGFCSTPAAIALIQEYSAPVGRFQLFDQTPKLVTNIVASLFFESSKIIGYNDRRVSFYTRDIVSEKQGLLMRGLAFQAIGESQRLVVTVPAVDDGHRKAQVKWETEKLY